MSLDRLEVTPAATVIGEIVSGRATGQWTIVSRDVRRDLYWAQGDLVLATTTSKDDSLDAFLVRKGEMRADQARAIHSYEPTEVAIRFFDTQLVPDSKKQALLREWTMSVVLPVFSLDEGTSVFASGTAIDPEHRIFLPSTAGLVLDGVRSITNGLILRRSLGDVQRRIRPARDSRFTAHNVPFTPDELRVASMFTEPKMIQEFLKTFPGESALAARTVIALLALGIAEVIDPARDESDVSEMDQSDRDLALMAAIGSNDQRSLHAVAFARQSRHTDYYRLLDVPKGATRALIVGNYEKLRRTYDPATFPPVVREACHEILHLLDQAHEVLVSPSKRQEYDKLMAEGRGGDPVAVHRMLVRRTIAEENYVKARELVLLNDFYGAIVLLKQTVHYSPEHAEAWLLLGSCQQRNPSPKWQRDAMDSFQRAIAANPNLIEAILSLGDLYRSSGLASRARACYEDALSIEPENGEAKLRLKGLT